MYFYKGSNDILSNATEADDAKQLIQKELLKVFDVHNLSFLLGAGCSSLMVSTDNGKTCQEIGIPVMAPMAEEFFQTLDGNEKDFIKDTVLIDITDKQYSKNLERFLEVLFSLKFLLEKQNKNSELASLEALISKTKKFIFGKCKNSEDKVISTYKRFYKKLIYRDQNLSKVNIFTTNYDLFSERALDQLGITFCNGFSGNIERYFNPTVFNYAYAEQMDLSYDKWNVIDNFVYLYKLHGSISWFEDAQSIQLFKIRERQEPEFSDNSVMIYPTPVKQNASFGTPYSDLFREFQKKLMKTNNALITIGYSFNDEHINNLIYQALTIPTFRLIILNSCNGAVQKLIDLNDPRIWVIGEKRPDSSNCDFIPVHYFSRVIDDLLPGSNEDGEIEQGIEAVRKLLSGK